ncbi:hypothetical protein [Streptomyces sp. NPDC003635]
MGIESDQVVFEYLSRVGDVAQQRQLPSGTRMRLVSELRNEIDRRRAKAPVDSPAAVRRIIARLGTPDEVVSAAGGDGGTPQTPTAAVPVQRRSGEEPVADVPSPPHLARAEELGDSALQPDWWRVDSSPFGAGEEVPGFVGGVEIPELLKPPPPRKPQQPKKETPEDRAAAEAVAEEPVGETVAPRRRFSWLLPSGRTAKPGQTAKTGQPGKKWSNPLLLLAAVLLLAGAVIGNLLVLILGWLLAYGSRRLTEAEKKGAVVVLPGLAVTAGVVWLWGRTEGRWGEPIADGQMNQALQETWPWVVRGAAVASALYLVWRSQRQK